MGSGTTHISCLLSLSLFCEQHAVCGQVENHFDKTSKFLFYIFPVFDALLFLIDHLKV